MTETGPDRSFERLFFLGGRVIRNSKGELELAQNGVDGGPLYYRSETQGRYSKPFLIAPKPIVPSRCVSLELLMKLSSS